MAEATRILSREKTRLGLTPSGPSTPFPAQVPDTGLTAGPDLQPTRSEQGSSRLLMHEPGSNQRIACHKPTTTMQKLCFGYEQTVCSAVPCHQPQGVHRLL